MQSENFSIPHKLHEKKPQYVIRKYYNVFSMIYRSKNKALHIYDNWCNKTNFNEWFVIMPIDEKYNELSLDGLLYEHSDDLEALYEIYKDEYGSGYGPAPFND